jgi:AcrR family transcriptional regulator
MPKGFSEREKSLITKILLEQGYKMFSMYGLKKTNIDEIAKASGISKGAFYNFFESKEALFMDVIEEAEKRARLEILAAINLPGPSPRARLFVVFKKAFSLFESVPLLRFFTGTDYDQLFRRIPSEKLQEHLDSDRVFLADLISQCRKAGIPIRVKPEQAAGLLYPLVMTMLQENDWIRSSFGGSLDLHLELIAAFCLGEVDTGQQKLIHTSAVTKGKKLS